MSATSEVPAAFRNAAGNRGPLDLIREGIGDIRSRRRLVRYLVQADIRKRGADTLLGNIWWVLDPLLQMVVYVVFVTIIVPAGKPPDYPLFIFSAILPWKWFTASIDRRDDLDRPPGPADQADPVPQARPARRGDDRRASSASRSGPSRSGMLMLFFPDRITPWLVFIPVIAAVQFVFTLACSFLVAAGNVFFRDLGNVVGHVLRLWWFLSPGLYSLASLDNLRIFEKSNLPDDARQRQPVRDPVRGVSLGHLRDDGRRRPADRPTCCRWPSCSWPASSSSAFTTIVFKRLEPNFAKVL